MKQIVSQERRVEYWLILVRIVWSSMALLAVGLVVVSVLTMTTSFYNLHIVVICNSCKDYITIPVKEAVETQSWFDAYAFYIRVLCVIFALSYFVVAGVLIWRKADDWMALFASFFFLLLAVSFCSEIPMLSPFWKMLIAHVMYLGITCLFLFFCLFPLGRLKPWWSYCLAVVVVLYWGTYALFIHTSFNPFEHFLLLNWIVEYGLLIGLAVAQIYRYKRLFDPEMRRKTRWVIFGACCAACLYLIQQLFVRLVIPHNTAHLFVQSISETLFFLSLLLIPLSIGIAILRSRLWNIDLIIHRTLVYGTLSACVVGLYILVVGGLGILLQAQGNILLSFLATGLISILFHPLRERLQRAVNYLVYGERNDPYRVLSHLGQRLEATLAPDAVLSTVVETVAQAFKLPYVAIALKQGEHFVPGAVYGQARQEDTLLHIELTYQKELLGELILASDISGEAFSAADRRLLEDLAYRAGVAVHSVRLSADIQHSREKLVMAREEERRRLRRDLHDGLGPQLASLLFLLTTVRKLLRKDPDAAEKKLSESMTYMQEAISDIRRLVYGLRPPSLDDLGLLATLREDIRRYQAHDIVFTLITPDPLPPLSAAVEVACYRIVQEALTNVINHAYAHHCTLTFSIDEFLDLEVVDDGRGIPSICEKGIGLTSMCERAQELGGTWSIDRVSEGGTRVHACLPIKLTEKSMSYQRKEVEDGAYSYSDR